MASNGQLSQSELSPIPGGQLSHDAAAAWNAPHGPAANNLRPGGPDSSYRSYERQVYYWNLYLSGAGNLAASPGTSNHGWGVAVDLAEPWMRSWIDDHGAEFGWRKTEAFSEWWHVNFVGGVSFPTFVVLAHGDRGKRVVKYSRRLAFIHRPGGKAYLGHSYLKFKDPMVQAVKDFQGDHDLGKDGVIGPKTARTINRVFHTQYQSRKGKRHRTLRQKARRPVEKQERH